MWRSVLGTVSYSKKPFWDPLSFRDSRTLSCANFYVSTDGVIELKLKSLFKKPFLLSRFLDLC